MIYENACGMTRAALAELAEGVRDDFGRSMAEDVFEPILSEIARLMDLAERTACELSRIDHLLEETASVGDL